MIMCARKIMSYAHVLYEALKIAYYISIPPNQKSKDVLVL